MDPLPTFLIEFAVILLLVLANGVFSMAEMAVVSSRKARLLQRAESGSRPARDALDLAENPNQFLSTVQVGITLIGTLTGAFGGASMTDEIAAMLRQAPLVAPYANGIAVGLIVLMVSYFSLVLGELVPKRLALADPEGVAASVSGPMKFIAALGRPVVWLLSRSTDLVLRLLRVHPRHDSPVTPEEITVLMEQGESSGIFEERETDIVEAVFRLGDLHAGSLMTPRTEIDWLDLDDSFEENLELVLSSGHSHFPAASSSLDDVSGIVRARDFLTLHLSLNGAPPPPGAVAEITLPAEFVPESMPGFQLLEVLRGAGANLALVIDEYGGLLGMVTLFDVMEAIVGGISIGGEPVIPEAVQREDGSWLIEGMMRIDEMKKILDLDELPGEERAGFETVGGFVMAQIGSIPTTGQSFNVGSWRFEVVDMDGLRVDKVLVSAAEFPPQP